MLSLTFNICSRQLHVLHEDKEQHAIGELTQSKLVHTPKIITDQLKQLFHTHSTNTTLEILSTRKPKYTHIQSRYT